MTDRKPREIGLTCWQNSGRGGGCRAQFNYVIPKGMRNRRALDTMEGEAGKAGWVIGLDNSGQAHYACPDCEQSLFDAMKLKALRCAAA